LLSAAIAAPAVIVALSLREPDLPEGEVRLAYGHLLRESVRTAFGAPAVRTMLILSALVTALTIAPHIFMQPFLAGHDVEVALLGVIQTPVRLASMIGALFAFWLVSRAGTRGVFISAPLLMVATYLALGSFDSVFVFAAFPIASFVNAALLPPAADYLNQRIPSSQRATILSLRMMMVSLAAAALEPALGVIADGASLRAVFFVTAGVVAIALPLALGLWLRADAQEREAAGA
ncbi:MAG: MFS transporter, partial [Dehalococcoidia bacterium]